MSNKEKRNSGNLLMFVLNNKALLLLLLIFIASAIMTKGDTLAPYNLISLMRQLSVYIIVAIGCTIVLAAGMMDLSIGEILSLCGVGYAMLALRFPIPVALIGAIVIGVICEFFNGFATRFFKIPGFVLTLASAQIFKGITYLLTDGRNISGMSAAVKQISQGKLFDVLPYAFLIAMVVVAAIAWLVNRTTYGRHLIATGGNGEAAEFCEAAEFSGIKVEFIRISSHVVAGVCIAIGGIVLTGRLGFASTTAGDGYMMDSIAAVVIGGTSLNGGKAKVLGTVFGIGLIVIINNMLNLMNVSAYWQWVCKGFIIIFAIVLDSVAEQITNKQRTKKTV